MRPIQLKMIYFGPYENETIDFTQLGTQSIFLISGKTGAGKTMMFDAMTFALYGEAASKERKITELRSQFADDDVPTEVIFTFASGTKTYEVSRTMKYTKPGKKSEVPSKLSVFDKDTGVLLAKSLTDGNALLLDIMKIDANQFRQILVLPQGEFKKFLLASSKDKSIVLRSLFETQRFDQLTLTLLSRAKKLKSELDLKSENLDTLLSRYKTDKMHTGDFKALFDFYSNDNKERSKAWLEKDDEVKALGSSIEKKRTALSATENDNETVKQKEAAEAELNHHKENDNERQQREQKLKKLMSIAAVYEKQQRYHNAKTRKDELTEETLKENTFITKQQGKLTVLEKEYSTLLEQSDEMIKLEQYVDDTRSIFKDDSFKDLQQQIKSYKSQIEEITMSLEDVSRELVDINELETKAAHQSEALEEQQEIKTKLLIQQSECKHVLNAVQQNNEKAKKLLKLKETQEELSRKREDILKHDPYISQQEQINMLRAHIHDGDMCPVCKQHVEVVPELISSEQQNEWQQVSDSLEETKHAILRFSDIEVQDEASARKASDEVDHALEDVNRTITLLVDGISEVKQTIKVQQELKEKAVALQHQLEQLKYKAQQSESKWSHFVQETKCDDYEQFAEYFQQRSSTLQDYALRKSQYEKEIIDVKHAIQSKRDVLVRIEAEDTRVSTELQQLLEEYASALKSSGLREEELTANTDSELKEHDAWLAEYQLKLIRLNEKYEMLKVQAADKEWVDVAPLITMLNDEVKAYEQIMADHQKNRYELDENKALLLEIDTKLTIYEKEKKEFEEVNELAEYFNGKNHQKLKLENFVLSYYLEQTLKASNLRLLEMTKHRYEFRRKSELSGNKSAGLDIEIFDYYSNMARDITTLSGGESFLASLSLALGLSDYVTQIAGGIRLESVFIDEGFGTLDSETLDTVVETLLEIERTGKLVGLISHVTMLKERIPAQLEVLTDGNKSKTKFNIK